MIKTLIGIGFGLYVVRFRSLLVAFMVNWLLNWFVFMPLDTFHPPAWQWPVGLLVLLIVWDIYQFGWLSKNEWAYGSSSYTKKEKQNDFTIEL